MELCHIHVRGFSYLVLKSVYSHDDVIKWKHFPRYWPFVRGIHRSPVNSPHKGQETRSFDVFFDLRLNERLSKQSWGWWFEMLSRPLWRYCNAISNCPLPWYDHVTIVATQDWLLSYCDDRGLWCLFPDWLDGARWWCRVMVSPGSTPLTFKSLH